MTADHDDRQLGKAPFDHFQKLDPIHRAVVQPDVQDDQVRKAVGKLVERFVAVACAARIITLVLQDGPNQNANVRFVVDDQNSCHYAAPRATPLGCVCASSP